MERNPSLSRPALVAVAAALALAGLGPGPGVRAAEPTRVFEDGEFLGSDWVQETIAIDALGTASLRRVDSGGAPGAYHEVDLYGGIFAVQIHTKVVYDPAVEGAIREIDHYELARTVGRLQRVAPALRQNNKLYIAYSISSDTTDYLPPVFTIANASEFTPIEFFGMRAEHYRTRFDANDHPDFSATGSPIEFGYFRAFGSADRAIGDIDQWRVTVNPAARLPLSEEIRAEAHATIVAEPNSGFSDVSYADVRARAPRDALDQVAVASWGIQGTELVDGVTYSRASLGSGLGARSDALIPDQALPFIDSIDTRSRASHRRKFVAQWTNPGPPPANVPMDVVMFGSGTLQLRSLLTVNPGPDPQPHELWAQGAAQIFVSRIQGNGVATAQVLDEWIRLNHVGVTASAGWQSQHDEDVGEDGKPVTRLSYFEVLNDAFTVPFSEEFAIEFVLETEAHSQDSAPRFAARADFANTLSFDVTTDTPGVQLIEVLSEVEGAPEPTELLGKRKLKIGKITRRKGKDLATLTIGDGVWAVEDAGKLGLGGTYEIADKKGRKLALTLDDESREALLQTLGLIASDGAGERVTVAIDSAKLPKLQASVNGKGTKLALKAKIKLLATVGDDVIKGVYTLNAKGAPPESLAAGE